LFFELKLLFFALNFKYMSLRFKAINNLTTDNKNKPVVDCKKITTIFGENVFTLQKARAFLNEDAYKSLITSIEGGKKIDRAVANQIANGIKAWAESKGVTHFSHWFQPLTGTTAEKHDSFFTVKGDGTPIEQFEGACIDTTRTGCLFISQWWTKSHL
jgi:glutamine synthetase